VQLGRRRNIEALPSGAPLGPWPGQQEAWWRRAHARHPTPRRPRCAPARRCLLVRRRNRGVPNCSASDEAQPPTVSWPPGSTAAVNGRSATTRQSGHVVRLRHRRWRPVTGGPSPRRADTNHRVLLCAGPPVHSTSVASSPTPKSVAQVRVLPGRRPACGSTAAHGQPMLHAPRAIRGRAMPLGPRRARRPSAEHRGPKATTSTTVAAVEGRVGAREFWDERYRSSAPCGVTRPPQLVAEVTGMAPGAPSTSDAAKVPTPFGWPAGMAGHRHRHLRRGARAGRCGRATPPRTEVADRITWERAISASARRGSVRSRLRPVHAPPRTRARPLHTALAAAVAPGGHC